MSLEKLSSVLLKFVWRKFYAYKEQSCPVRLDYSVSSNSVVICNFSFVACLFNSRI